MLFYSILGPGHPVVSLKHFHTFFMPLIWGKYRDKAGMLFGECGELAFKYFFLFLICSYLFRKFIKTGVDIFARVLLQESRRRTTLTFTLVVYGQFLRRFTRTLLWFNNKSPILRRSSLILWTKKRPFRVLFSNIVTCE